VARLFGLIGPDLAVFGAKDYQQLAVIRRMVRDLALGVEILAGPIVRDSDGLALSSRNRSLSPEARGRALSLSAALRAMALHASSDVETLLSIGREVLDVDRVDYLEIVDPHSLEQLDSVKPAAQALVAAFVGGTRLIDNLRIERATP
jgi:pantoate--beta-alanine ligase